MTVRSKRLVEFLASLPARDPGPALTGKATIALLDSLGCGIFGARQHWGKIVNTFVLSEKSQGAATLFGSRQTVGPARAALANGTSTHGFEFDDTLYAQSHPGAVVVPAALAAAEHMQASGALLLVGIIAGYEMMGRLVQALGIDHGNRGYHTTGVAGPVAATIAAGLIMRLDVNQLLSAIGNACSGASGIKAFTQGTGGMTKRMHAGRAAETGVLACELARHGFTGPLAAIDGSFGLLQVIGGAGAQPELLDHALGAAFAIDNLCVKVYPSCAVTHSTSQALESLKQEFRFTPDMINEIRIHTSTRGVTQNGDRDPVDAMAAQYSLPYCAGVAVARDPRDPAVFSDAHLQDPVVRQVAAKTVLLVDEAMNRIYPTQLGARVEISLSGGQEIQATVLDAHGSIADPCTPDDVVRKFRLQAGAVKSAGAVERIIAATYDLPNTASMQGLSAALRVEDE